MKNYDEVADELFQRRDEYLKKQKIKKVRHGKIIISTSAVLAVAVIGTGIWKSGFLTSANVPEAENFEAVQKKTEIIEKTTLDNTSEKSEKNANTKKDEASDSQNGEKTTTAKTEKKTHRRNNDKAPSSPGEVISSFEGAGNYGMPCYAMPEDGEYVLSYPVRWSIDKYGDTKKYLLCIIITKNGNLVTDAEKSAELNRLKKAGCDIKKYTLWTYSGANADRLYYTQIGGVFTYEQITTLFTDREYGYFFDFMSNGDSSPATVSDGSEFFEKTTKKGENYFSTYN